MNEYKHVESSDFANGDHFFSGKPVYSSDVNLCIDPLDLDSMIELLREQALKLKGINGIQSFKNANGDILLFHDHLSSEKILELQQSNTCPLELHGLNRFNVYFAKPPKLPEYEEIINR